MSSIIPCDSSFSMYDLLIQSNYTFKFLIEDKVKRTAGINSAVLY